MGEKTKENKNPFNLILISLRERKILMWYGSEEDMYYKTKKNIYCEKNNICVAIS